MPDPNYQDRISRPQQPLDPHHALASGSTRITDPAHQLPEHASEDGGKKSSPLRIILIVAFLLLVAGVVFFIIHRNNVAKQAEADKAAQAANRPTPVQVALVQKKTVPVFLTALGTVTAYNTVTLHSRVDGQLLTVNFTEGQAVRKGALLLQIDPRPYQAAVDQAEGTLAKDQANLKNTEAEAQRYTALYQAGVVSKEQQQLQIANSGQAAGSIKSDQAAIEAAKVNLGYTRIYSPIDGVVGLRQVDPGNIVHASDSTGLIVITQVHPIAVIFTLPEDQLPQVQDAMKGGKKLVVEAYDRTDSHKIAAGTLLTIDNQIDTTTGTAKLKAIFDNADNLLFANQFVNVRLILRERENAILVPTAAISSGTQGDYVFVVNPGAGKPQGGAAAAGGGGRGAGHGGGTTPADASGGAAGAGGSSDSTGTRTGPDGKPLPPQPKFHVDSVAVHVDFTIGTNSIVQDGALHEGQKVVVDGQEKLLPGGNVSPKDASANGAGGASGATGASGNRTPYGDKGSSGASGQSGASGASGPGSSRHGGHQQ